MKQRHKVIGTVLVVLERNGCVFFIKRKNTGWQDGRFDLIAGHIEEGERVAEAAIREAQEEAGITIKKDDLQLIHVMSLKRQDGDGIYFTFKVHDWKGEPNANEIEKSDGCKWISKSNIDESEALDTIKYAFRCIHRGELYSEFN